MHRVTLAAHEMIDGIPIYPAEVLQRGLCLRGICACGGEHNRPMRRHKYRNARGGFIAGMLAFIRCHFPDFRKILAKVTERLAGDIGLWPWYCSTTLSF